MNEFFEKLESLPLQNKNIGVLFSGGLDSSVVSALLLTKGYEITLITINNGAMKNVEISKSSTFFLEKIGKGKIKEHVFLPSDYLFREIGVRKAVEDIMDFKKDYSCVGCKLAMLAVTIAYCKKYNISVLVDGFIKAQDFYPEQTQAYIEATHQLCKDYDISLHSPIYCIESKDQVKQLAQQLNIPAKSFDATCLFEERPIRAKEEDIKNYIQKKLPEIRKHISFLLRLDESNKECIKPSEAINSLLLGAKTEGVGVDQ